ncbi:hypothetical protein H6F98_04415 [Microcoleus sp. FACHB-SPT15]|uniref:hypothetical protein n=1 Tax=Microcoleus sp. FACHB-SPT15 TaxID=2692830 RepID=UPI0017806D95|nr:hypothetical protein [Microcoleus sp. FACHB-SPT15]MBD1804716.1 hypothetical protein [Microcoleus sp. FACHB-SPT15]
MIKRKLALAALLSTTTIASGVLLSSASSAQPCSRRNSDSYQELYEQANWLRSSLAAFITLPGIAIATALSVGYRYYKS